MLHGRVVIVFAISAYVILVIGIAHYYISKQPLIEVLQDKWYEQRVVNESTNISSSKNDVLPKLILPYSTLHGKRYWFGVIPKDLNVSVKVENCDYSCVISYDRHAVAQADALLFHGPDVYYDVFMFRRKLYTAKSLRLLAKEKKAGQKWVFYAQESPHYYGRFHDYYFLFDWTMSYKVTSDIFIPMHSFYTKINDVRERQTEKINYASNKSKIAIWMASHCRTKRIKYIDELRHYIPITFVGKCPQGRYRQSVECKGKSKECVELIKSHKFYFAFENSFCDYYITEKYWYNGIAMGLVPVVMGPQYDKHTVIPGSYINVFDFDSIESLANYLKFLDQNETAYNRYFEWKNHYKTYTPKLSLECEVCKALWSNVPSRSYKNVWPREEDCMKHKWKEEFIEKLAKDSRKSRMNHT